MLTGNVKSAFDGARADGHAPRAVIERLSAGLRPFDDGRFVTVFCGLLQPDRTLEYVNAGHPPPLVTAPDGTRTELTLTGPLVTPMLAGEPLWESARVELPAGAHLFACTDGVLEARGEEGLFGPERLMSALDAPAADGAERIANVLRAVRAFAAGRPLDDDLTLLTLDIG
jgi:serine phosphatase RsbU (regulator of sigma subunit)